MWKNIVTNEVYKDRKEAKTIMGHAAFNKALQNGEVILITTHTSTDIII
jgi:hypothetical protein